MTTALIWFKKHWLVCLATLVVAGYTGGPSIVFFQRVGADFKGVFPVFNGDALYYQARVQEIADGHGQLNHPYFFEHKDTAYPQAAGAEYFVYGLTKLFGVSAPALQVILDFVAPAVIFLLTYLLFKKISSNEYTAVLFPALLYTVVMGGLFKPVNPQITFPLLLLFLIFWARLILLAEKKWLNSVIAGLVWGLLFLSYFYHWSFLVVVVGIYILILLLSKSWVELKYYVLMIGIAGLVGIPYFLRVFSSLNAPFHTETAVRVGQYFSHWPESYPRLLVALVWLAFFIWFSRVYKIGQEKRARIVMALLIANVAYPNHQILTGLIIQNALHWSWMPILIFALSAHYSINIVRLRGVSIRRDYLVPIFIGLLAALPAWRLSTFTWQPYLDKYHDGVTEGRQYYAELFQWINKNTKPDDVILSDLRLVSFIPAYTQANAYYADYAYNLPGSDAEIVERALLSRIFEPDFFTVKEFGLNNGTRILWSFPYESEKNTHIIAGRWAIPFEPRYSLDKEKQAVRAVYDGLLKEEWGMRLLKKYRLDYVVWDKIERPEWTIGQYKDLELVAELGNIMIYRLKV